jgi:hypothetical protein
LQANSAIFGKIRGTGWTLGNLRRGEFSCEK